MSDQMDCMLCVTMHRSKSNKFQVNLKLTSFVRPIEIESHFTVDRGRKTELDIVNDSVNRNCCCATGS